MKGFYWKLVLSATVTLISITLVLPTIVPNLWPHKKINLGLDLQGGMHVVLAVDTDKTIEASLKQISDDIRSMMRKKRINGLGVENIDGTKLRVILKGEDEIRKFEKILCDDFPNLRRSECNLSESAFPEVIVEFGKKESNNIRNSAINQALETIRNRIDQFGVSEPDIRLYGHQHILIQLPGISNIQRAKEIIGRTAMLEFRIVNETVGIENIMKGPIPSDSIVMYRQGGAITKDNVGNLNRPILVKKQAHITGAHLTDARVHIDSANNTPYVTIKLSKTGAKIFEKVTSGNLNRRMAIVLDGKIHSMPVITEIISGGDACITGKFTLEEAKDLAIVLRAGALPAPVKIIEERTVGPSLGMDSIMNGLTSICIASILVALFMVIYYKIAGLIVNLALLLNVLIVAAGLAGFHATLTLPGIAGIILTIGMAVDANVLIFERIKEEIRLGRSPIASVIAGYDRATLTILDANMTTLIAALVLFQFGTGPVKGFAITLSLGILASLFTSLMVTRMIFEYFLVRRRVKIIGI